VPTPFSNATPSPRVGRPVRLGALAGVALLAVAGACGGAPSSQPSSPPPSSAAGPLIVQAGAPGQASRAFDGTSLDDVEGVAYTEADISFMQGMIHHHAQALAMTALITERTTTRAIRQMGLRMEISQADEIAIMERWLRDRGQAVPDWRPTATPAADPGAHAGMDHAAIDHGAHAAMDHGAMDHGAMDHGTPAADAHADHDGMPGMLTPEQMTQLAAARGGEFDRLFLQLMIQHHEGALTMVRDLFASAGAGQESTVFQFASEIDADQDIEIRRMRELLEAWP